MELLAVWAGEFPLGSVCSVSDTLEVFFGVASRHGSAPLHDNAPAGSHAVRRRLTQGYAVRLASSAEAEQLCTGDRNATGRPCPSLQ